MPDRSTYNRAHYAIQKQRNEELKRFKELYPDRYAELVAKVKAESQSGSLQKIQTPQPICEISGTTLEYANVPDIVKFKITSFGKVERRWPLSKEDLNEILYPLDHRDVIIHTKEHIYFEAIPIKYDDINTEILKVLDRRHPEHDQIVSYELCNCPSCLRRVSN